MLLYQVIMAEIYEFEQQAVFRPKNADFKYFNIY